jgi:hypothetical protein
MVRCLLVHPPHRVLSSRRSFTIPRNTGGTPSRPTRAGETASAARASPRLTPIVVAMPRIWPAMIHQRATLRLEKNATKTSKSSILVGAKTPTDSTTNETVLKMASAFQMLAPLSPPVRRRGRPRRAASRSPSLKLTDRAKRPNQHGREWRSADHGNARCADGRHRQHGEGFADVFVLKSASGPPKRCS